ncbi:MAG: GTP 3',8-cyclase MoaA [bacterium]
MLSDKFNRPLKDLRISVTDRCNFRCNYCMPADIFGHDYSFLSRRQILNFEEVYRVAKVFVGLGVTKIRLTGGEPLLRHELEVLIGMLAQIEGLRDLALTTNGYLLKQYAGSLRKAGLRRLTVSLDTLDPRLLKTLAGKHLDLGVVLEGIEEARAVGFNPIKINSVIQKGVNERAILELARFARDEGHILRFIEYMDVGNLNGWRMDRVISAQEIVDLIASEMPLEPVAKEHPSEVANRYRYLDGKGEIGVIASVTRPFCGNCTRMRLSADGKLYTCLFASRGFDLKTPLRAGASDPELRQLIAAVWHKRMDRYSEERAFHTSAEEQEKIEMYQIGG